VSVEDNQVPYVGPERRKSFHTPDDCPLSDLTKMRFDEGNQRMNRFEEMLHANTEATKEVLEILQMGKGFFRTVGVIGSVVKWCAGIAVAVLAAWHGWQSRP